MDLFQQEQQQQQQFTAELKVVTWNKDSHGLFDYESKSVDLKQVRIDSTCQLYFTKKQQNNATKEDIILIDKNNLNQLQIQSQETTYFLTQIDVQKDANNQNKFTLNPFSQECQAIFNSYNKLDYYLIVRSLKDNFNQQKGYSLQLGDIVKFGRIEYQVLKMRTNQEIEENPIKQYFEQQEIQLRKQSSENQGQQLQCKICLGDDQSNDNFFTNLCQCKGSCEFAHFQCLKYWIQSNQKYKDIDNYTLIQWKKNKCELCGIEYPKFIKYKGVLHSIINIDVPEGIPYIVLESLGNDNKISKNIYIIKMQDPDQEIKIGRGNQCQLRIADISVSRIHSNIKYRQNQFIISDNNSKFGTLIKMKESIQINTEKKAIQIGRVVITFALKKNNGMKEGNHIIEVNRHINKQLNQQQTLPNNDNFQQNVQINYEIMQDNMMMDQEEIKQNNQNIQNEFNIENENNNE